MDLTIHNFYFLGVGGIMKDIKHLSRKSPEDTTNLTHIFLLPDYQIQRCCHQTFIAIIWSFATCDGTGFILYSAWECRIILCICLYWVHCSCSFNRFTRLLRTKFKFWQVIMKPMKVKMMMKMSMKFFLEKKMMNLN